MRYKIFHPPPSSLFLLSVFAQQSSNPVTAPTPIRLIEKYPKYEEGREQHWVLPQHEASTEATVWKAGESIGNLDLNELQRRKKQRLARGGGFQKRAVPPEHPVPTSSPQCEPFEHVDTDLKILYSPGYPGNYPNNTNCHVVLEGNAIHLVNAISLYFHLLVLFPRDWYIASVRVRHL